MPAANVDRLSEVLDGVVIRGLVPGGFAVRGPWVTRPALERPLKLIAIVSGRPRLTTDRHPRPIVLASGDVAIVREPTWITLEGGVGYGTPQEIVPQDDAPATRLSGADLLTHEIIVGGRLELNQAGRALLAETLPPVAHVRAAADTASRLRAILELVFRELRERRPGAAFAVGQLGRLLVLEVLRTHLEQVELPSGWLRLLTDEELAPAVALMHGQPGHGWRLDELARACAMSRTSFAERFRHVAGLPAITYLNRWRMLQARRALRESDVDVATLGDRLGFASGSAFSAAFKREVGEPPGRYRRRASEPEATARL